MSNTGPELATPEMTPCHLQPALSLAVQWFIPTNQSINLQ